MKDDNLIVTMTIAELRQLVRDEAKAAITNHQPKPKLTFNTAEAAEIVGVPETWLATAAREGRIPVVRIGHYVRFKLSDLEQFILKQSERKAG